MPKNEYGLSRSIPVAVKREVRLRSKNGCVVCRSLIYQYEHFDPDFADAKEHKPDGICLLCASCHQDVTAGRLGKQQVKAAYAKVRFSDDISPPFYTPHLAGNCELRLGASVFRYLHQGLTLLSYDGEEKLSLCYVQDSVFGGYRPSISGTINDVSGSPIVGLDDNCITAMVNSLDITLEGSRLTFRSGPREKDICLQFSFSGDGSITINRARMTYRDITIELDNVFGVTVPHLSAPRVTFLIGAIFDAPSEIISYNSDRSSWKAGDMMIQSEGINLPGTGCHIARNCPAMTIQDIRIWDGSPFDAEK